MAFDKWWAKQPKDPTEPITPRMAWDAAMIYSAQAANERIRELDDLLASRNVAVANAECLLREQYAAEREVSDKLVTALEYMEAYLESALDDEGRTGRLMSARMLLEDARKFISEVAAIRAKQGGEG